jgi:hypothetical protein
VNGTNVFDKALLMCRSLDRLAELEVEHGEVLLVSGTCQLLVWKAWVELSVEAVQQTRCEK